MFTLETVIVSHPIFDSRQRVFGYELLFRSNLEIVFRHQNSVQATAIIDVLFLIFTKAFAGIFSKKESD